MDFDLIVYNCVSQIISHDFQNFFSKVFGQDFESMPAYILNLDPMR